MAQTNKSAPLTHKAVLSIAGPIVLSNLSTPLLGIIDTGVVGQLGDPKHIGAVAVGALIFNFIYWAFGFLRMGTTGLTAQAHGAGDIDEIRATLGRALFLACIAGLALIVLQTPIQWAALLLIDATLDVEAGAHEYYTIRIWSAPFSLANFALLGWFIGRQQAHLALALQLFLNGLNASLDALFVLGFGWGVSGIAMGTVIAEVAAALLGFLLVGLQLRHAEGALSPKKLFEWRLIRRTLAVNQDIMIRTLLLMFAFAYFTAKSAQAGNILLAANTILMQFVFFTAYFLDGFAFACEALVGHAIGARDRRLLIRAIKLSTLWAGLIALLLSTMLYIAGPQLIDIITIDPDVRQAARIYLGWSAVLPIFSVWCWQIDGIFIGATRTREMRNAAIFSLASFFAFWWAFIPFGNHGLWAAIVLFNIARAAALGRYMPSLLRSVPT